MKEPKLVRVDFRLMHGQVVTGWLKKFSVNRLLIVDDKTKADPYLGMVFELAKPQGVSLQMLSFAEAGSKCKDESLIRANDSALVLLKTIQGAKAAFDAGFQFRELQIGTTEGGAGKKAIGVCYLSREDAEALRDLSSAGVHIYFQSNCDSKAQDWSSLQAKHFPDL